MGQIKSILHELAKLAAAEPLIYYKKSFDKRKKTTLQGIEFASMGFKDKCATTAALKPYFTNLHKCSIYY